jgi:hypothetical protein
MAIGPLVGQVAFMAADWRLIRAGDRAVLRGWLGMCRRSACDPDAGHRLSPMPVWAYSLSAYLGLSILKIRTFLEHQAMSAPRPGR